MTAKKKAAAKKAPAKTKTADAPMSKEEMLKKYPPANPTRVNELKQAREQRLANEKAQREAGKPAKAGESKGVIKTFDHGVHIIDKPTAAFVGKRAAVLAAAQAGKLPPPPDFSAETHTRFRPKLAELVKMAKAGDIAGLKAVEIKTYSTSPKAMDRYRNLAVIALEAKAAKAKADV